MTTRHVGKLKPENQQQVQTFIEDILQRSKLPGISVAMDVNGQTLEAAAGVGDAKLGHPMGINTHFELGCLNKFLTAIIVLELVNENKIGLEDVIAEYLPELEGRNGNKIKVKHLLSHTAGYQGENLDDPDVQMDYSYEKFCKSFNQRPMLFEPGTRFDYSYSASVILGRMIESVVGEKVKNVMEEKIFKPLGIKVVGRNRLSSDNCVNGHKLDLESAQLLQIFSIEWNDFWSNSMGGLWISMRDLVKIGKMIIEKISIVSRQTKQLLLNPVIKLPGIFVGDKSETVFFQFGLGCARFPNGSYGVRSNSQGQSCALRFDGEVGMVIAVAINANAAYLRDFTIDKLFNGMLSEDAKVIPDLFSGNEAALPLENLVGNYEGALHHRFTISLEGERLVLRAGHNPCTNQSNSKALAYLFKDKQGYIKVKVSELGLSIRFFESSKSGKYNLMVGDSCYVKCKEGTFQK